MSKIAPKARFAVLAAIDDSELQQEVVRVAANFAHAFRGGELHLIHVVEDLPPPAVLVPPPPGLGATTAEITAAARGRLDAIGAEARRHFGGRIVEHLAAGSARKQILQVAFDVQADVILVGTHGRTGVKRMMLGSVAETVARKACCPVIVVRVKDYHSAPAEIEPACPRCRRAQEESNGALLWCDAHAKGDERRGYVHYEARP